MKHVIIDLDERLFPADTDIDGIRDYVETHLIGQMSPVLADYVMRVRAVDGNDAELYEKCARCHLFVEPNDVEPVEGIEFAKYIHLHRGDDADEAIECSHEATPSGLKATLGAWRVYGPSAMRERFVVK